MGVIIYDTKSDGISGQSGIAYGKRRTMIFCDGTGKISITIWDNYTMRHHIPSECLSGSNTKMYLVENVMNGHFSGLITLKTSNSHEIHITELYICF